ncbi:MAG: UDP-N-acetylglucosamine 1-carboxyvinyltransferase, partial [Clostridia bacterium]|nr:UDP-N-acetylglucosamine 1-carboxyvinyltransferase [Clostridia bacterium]
MDYITVEGGRALKGYVQVHGAKNSILPILAASVLTESICVIENCPHLTDVAGMTAILKAIGCQVTRDGRTVTVDSNGPIAAEISATQMSALRSSITFLGALLARCGRAELFLPGGCELGSRPVDIHLWALMRMGAKIRTSDGRVQASVTRPTGCELVLPIPSVGATENIMLFATACEGETVIVNAAREPELVDLQNYLNAAGFFVSGAGTPVIRIRGGRREAPTCVRHRAIPDRIAAATWMCAATACGGEVTMQGVDPFPLTSLAAMLTEMGARTDFTADTVTVRRTSPLRALTATVRTGPYPGFPTDMQPLLMVPAVLARGQTVFEENMFDSRYRHVPELNRMGA